jgi:hypothetical protein
LELGFDSCTLLLALLHPSCGGGVKDRFIRGRRRVVWPAFLFVTLEKVHPRSFSRVSVEGSCVALRRLFSDLEGIDRFGYKSCRSLKSGEI